MSAKRFSPGATLLRHSRAMAMPPPVPPPPASVYNTPPAPYPTLQAITTPTSSAARGDWGLKRDIPLKTSQKTEYLRYNDMDTWMHMTTFESAHDDVLTLKKWQEMDVPISKHSSLQSVFSRSRNIDSSDSVFDGDGEAPESYRWRFDGPHLPDMSKSELHKYIVERVIPRQDEFRKFVAMRQALTALREKREKSGETVSDEALRQEAAEQVEGGADVDMLALRANPTLLESWALEFLDIPLKYRPYCTHPSAGLHYTRSNAYIVNDPETGPQEERPSVPGRPLNFLYEGNLPGVGVAGIVARKLMATSQRRTPDVEAREIVNMYRPSQAFVNEKGRIMLQVQQTNSSSSKADDFQASEYSNPSSWVDRADRGSWRSFYGGPRQTAAGRPGQQNSTYGVPLDIMSLFPSKE